MKLHKDDPESLEPCPHMESMLNRTAEGSAPKWMRWYAESHARGCDRCGRFLTRVRALIGQLRGANTTCPLPPAESSLSPDRWEAVESQWAEIEK